MAQYCFNSEIAYDFGVNEAIILQNLYWLKCHGKLYKACEKWLGYPKERLRQSEYFMTDNEFNEALEHIKTDTPICGYVQHWIFIRTDYDEWYEKNTQREVKT